MVIVNKSMCVLRFVSVARGGIGLLAPAPVLEARTGSGWKCARA